MISVSELDAQDMNFDFLEEWFSVIRKCTLADLILPRIVWLHCDGLPSSAWTKDNWVKIIGDWGYIISEPSNKTRCGMLQKLKICIQTHKTLNISETLKVVIDGLSYWVVIKESKVEFDAQDIITPLRHFDDEPPSPGATHHSPSLKHYSSDEDKELDNDIVNLQEDLENSIIDITPSDSIEDPPCYGH